MRKRIYTFEVDIEDEDGVDLPSLDKMGEEIAHMVTARGRPYYRVDGVEKVAFIESFSEEDWDDMIYRPMRAR